MVHLLARAGRVLRLGPLSGVVALACASEVPDYTPDADTGSQHAVVTVQRVESTGLEDSAVADAFAQFVSVPVHADPGRVLQATGVARQILPPDTCASTIELEEGAIPLASLGPVEFLEVGEVSIAATGVVTPLGAHAFPSVSDFASGVVYATRGRAADLLPAGAPYLVSVDGASAIAPMHVQGEAPPSLDNVTLNGLPLAEVIELPTSAPVDVTWAVGEPGDVIYVELAGQDRPSAILCAFRDEDGSGTVAPHELLLSGIGRVAVHRIRIQQFKSPGLATGELRFDFQQTVSVDFIE